MIVYVVTMQRWGDSESHNYVVGAYTDVLQAKEVGLAHRAWRGGKYEPSITEVEIDSMNIEVMEHWEKCK
ncbi:hypothetical protein D3C85_693450 [compost metagenome]